MSQEVIGVMLCRGGPGALRNPTSFLCNPNGNNTIYYNVHMFSLHPLNHIIPSPWLGEGHKEGPWSCAHHSLPRLGKV